MGESLKNFGKQGSKCVLLKEKKHTQSLWDPYDKTQLKLLNSLSPVIQWLQIVKENDSREKRQMESKIGLNNNSSYNNNSNNKSFF